MSAASRAREKARGGMSHQDRNAADFGARSRGLVVHHGQQLEKRLATRPLRAGLFAGALLSVIEGLEGFTKTSGESPMFGKQPTKLRPEEVRGAQILNPQAQAEDNRLPAGKCLKVCAANEREYFSVFKCGMHPQGIFLEKAWSRSEIAGVTEHTALTVAGGYTSELADLPDWLAARLNQEQ